MGKWESRLGGISKGRWGRWETAWRFSTVSIRYGPHVVGRYRADGLPIQPESRGKGGSVETVENQKPVSHRSHRPLEIPKTRDSHFSTAPTTMSLPNSKTKTKTKTKIKTRKPSKPPSASRRGSAG